MSTHLPTATLTDWMQTLTGKPSADLAKAEDRQVRRADADAEIRRDVDRLDRPSRVA